MKCLGVYPGNLFINREAFINGAIQCAANYLVKTF